jgi:hypothetical protein
MPNARPNCSVKGCKSPADFEVILYDVYVGTDVFFERDFTCPFLCFDHDVENEEKAKTYPEPEPSSGPMLVSVDEFLKEGLPDLVPAETTRKYRGVYHYPYSNQHRAQGFTVYKPLGEKK